MVDVGFVVTRRGVKRVRHAATVQALTAAAIVRSIRGCQTSVTRNTLVHTQLPRAALAPSCHSNVNNLNIHYAHKNIYLFYIII